jgi:hypothetical protein
VDDRLPQDVELAWDSFHQVVNMTAEEMHAWLLAGASGEDAFPAQPDMGLPELGREVIGLLRKRKVDLTAQDAEVMERVTDYVNSLEANPPAAGARRDTWRWSLMTVGHDPLRT